MQKVADLKGKIVATNAAGSAVDIAMRAMLRKHGLEDKRDYTMIEAPFPTMKAMLAQKKADLAPFVAPFSFDPELKQIARPLFSPEGRDRHHADDRLGGAQGLHREEPRRHGRFHGGFAARRALVSRSRESRRSGADRARVTKQPPERFAGWLFTDKDYARSPDLLPDLAALQANIDVQRDLGFLKGPIDVQKYVDLSLVREAATAAEMRRRQ